MTKIEATLADLAAQIENGGELVGVEARLNALIYVAERAEDQAEICRLADELEIAQQQYREDNGQFGVGA